MLIRHLLRNACLPMITLVGLSIPTLLAGNLLIEYAVQLPGPRAAVLQRARQQDYNVLLAYTILGGVLTVIGNLIADIADHGRRSEDSPWLIRPPSRWSRGVRRSARRPSRDRARGRRGPGHRQRLAARAARVLRQPARGRRASRCSSSSCCSASSGRSSTTPTRPLTNPLDHRPAARRRPPARHRRQRLRRARPDHGSAARRRSRSASSRPLIATVIGTLYGADRRARRRPRRRRS